MASDIIARGIAAKAAADLKKTAADLEDFKEDTAEALAGKADLVDGKVPSEQLPSYVDDVVEYADVESFPATGEFGKIYVALDTGYTYRWSGSEYIQIGGQDLSVITGNFAEVYDPTSTYEEGDFCIYEDAFYVANQDIDPAEAWDASHWDRTSAAAVFASLQAEDARLAAALGAHEADTNNPHSVTKAQVGLGNVDDTSDLDKPISTATQAALDLKANSSDVEAALDLKLDAADYIVDDEISASSENPVQNKVIKSALDEKVDEDDTTNLGIGDEQVEGAPLARSIIIGEDSYNIPAKTSDIENDSGYVNQVDDEISASSENPVQNKVIKAALDEKVDEDDTTNFTMDEDQVEGAPLLGSMTIDEDSYNIPRKTSELENDAHFVEEEDTTDLEFNTEIVEGAPLLRSISVGEDDYNLPSKTSDLTNDSGYVDTVDAALSDVSENPVQNKVVKAALDEKVDEGATSGMTISEQQVAGAPLMGSITIEEDSFNIPTAEDLKAVTYEQQSPSSAEQAAARGNLGLGSAALKDAGNSAGEVPVIGQDGKLDSSILPATAITDTYVVNSEAAMLALDAQVGDVAVRTDLNKTFILKEAGADVLSHWQELLTPPDTVVSVNNKTGAVVLNKSDVGLGNVDNTSDLNKPISTATQAALDLKQDIIEDATELEVRRLFRTEYSVTATVVHGELVGPSTIWTNETTSFQFSAGTGYVVPETVVVTGGVAVYDVATGALTISDVVGNVTITAECPLPKLETPVISINQDTLSVNTIEGASNLQVYDGDTLIGSLTPPPTKGDVIKFDAMGDGNLKRFRVFSVDGNIAYVLSITDKLYHTYYSSTYPGSNVYAGSLIDVYCDDTYYNSLASDVKSAIVDTEIYQQRWYRRVYKNELSNPSLYIGITDPGDSNKVKGFSKVSETRQIGSRHCFALSAQDIFDYLGIGYGDTINGRDFAAMIPSDIAYGMLWLRDMGNYQYSSLNPFVLMKAYQGHYGMTDVDPGYGISSNDYSIYPAFRIDLTKIAWQKEVA